ncbi:YcnI family protein [Sinomonas sp. P10A9]|uniref:YcnI family protein n=1 Tax=Sinomonas puerhi TaxID=3238584 RepID=A0AB39L592_9MICC
MNTTTQTTRTRRATRAVAPAVVAGGLLLAAAGAASAHVGIDPTSTAAGSSTLLTLAIPHGCGDSPTTKLTISLPAEIADATPTVNPNWTVEKVTQKLDTPQKTADGATITQRTGQIVYTAKTPLDPHQRDTFVLSLKLPADAAGRSLYFPTLQTCEQGQTDWKEIPAAGQDHDSLKAPAPSITVTAAATAASAGGTHAGHTATEALATAEPASSTTAESGSAAGWVGLGAGLAGLLLGGVALFRTRGRRA